MKSCISNGLVIDPETETMAIRDIWIKEGQIIEPCPCSEAMSPESEEIDYFDATGKWVVPGLIDLHVHFREPGFEHKETILTGSAAALTGGFTTVCCMPNTAPVADSKEVVKFMVKQAAKNNGVQVLPIGAITRDQAGETLADYLGMQEEGICAISEDGKSVMDRALMKEAMLKAAALNLPVFAHTEDPMLSAGGSMNLGLISEQVGVPGIPKISEESMVERDLKLAEETGARVHLCHISTKGSVDLIRKAKAKGIPVTAETAPHYFTLTDSDLVRFDVSKAGTQDKQFDVRETEQHRKLENGELWLDANKKMNPPLRSAEDVEAIKAGLKDGTIDAIATDHAPHHLDEKNLDFLQAPFGVVGLETSFSVSYTELVRFGLLTPLELIDRMSTGPAKILGIHRGNLAVGAIADLTIIDVDKNYRVNADRFKSKGRNTPFEGKQVWGEISAVMIGGMLKGAHHD